jgi:hypothetical protein
MLALLEKAAKVMDEVRYVPKYKRAQVPPAALSLALALALALACCVMTVMRSPLSSHL